MRDQLGGAQASRPTPGSRPTSTPNGDLGPLLATDDLSQNSTILFRPSAEGDGELPNCGAVWALLNINLDDAVWQRSNRYSPQPITFTSLGWPPQPMGRGDLDGLRSIPRTRRP